MGSIDRCAVAMTLNRHRHRTAPAFDAFEVAMDENKKTTIASHRVRSFAEPVAIALTNE